jgi:hypothetical protein
MKTMKVMRGKEMNTLKKGRGVAQFVRILSLSVEVHPPLDVERSQNLVAQLPERFGYLFLLFVSEFEVLVTHRESLAGHSRDVPDRG